MDSCLIFWCTSLQLKCKQHFSAPPHSWLMVHMNGFHPIWQQFTIWGNALLLCRDLFYWCVLNVQYFVIHWKLGTAQICLWWMCVPLGTDISSTSSFDIYLMLNIVNSMWNQQNSEPCRCMFWFRSWFKHTSLLLWFTNRTLSSSFIIKLII